MRFYLAFMMLIVLLDLFDRLFERHGCRLKQFDSFPDKAIVFGRMTHGPHESRFLIVKIPFLRSWGITNDFSRRFPEFGFRSHKLFWFEGPEYSKGWHIWPPFEG